MAAAVVAVASSAAVAGATPARLASGDALESTVLRELNRVRISRGLRALRLSRQLGAAAELHSREMARLGFFAHESPGGGAFWKRLQRFYGSAGYRTWSVGENLLWVAPSIDARGAVKMWMRSAGHRRVILEPRYREIGIAAVHASAAPGVFGGREVTIVTTDFGVRG